MSTRGSTLREELSSTGTGVVDEIVQVKEACGPAHLKVIVEVDELGGYDHIRHATWLSMEGGADFVKTSTGIGAGVVLASKQNARLKHIEFVQLEPRRGLVVLVGEDG